MMKKIILPIFPVLAMTFVACSSSEKNESTDESMIVNETPAPGTATAKKVEKATNAKVEANSQNNLIEAIRTGNEETIYKTATTVLAMNSADARALMALGMYHYKKGRPQLALYFYSRVLSQKIASSDLYNNMGLANLALKEQKEAIRLFRKALEINPTDLNAAGNLSSIYLQSHDFAKAYIVLEMAMKKGSQDIRLLTNYALASAAKGKLEQAEGLYRDVFKINQNYKEGLYNFAVFQIEYQKKMKEGLETIAKIKFLGPGENMKSQIIALENKANAGLK